MARTCIVYGDTETRSTQLADSAAQRHRIGRHLVLCALDRDSVRCQAGGLAPALELGDLEGRVQQAGRHDI